ncbi:secretion protein HlyD [Desulfuromonas versatilis]|uniref:Secretion protein HlyD n=1 Tax=Desulfuromonas versatilis TaxID=2802975 RepID=A0ABM8HQT2_9BACT|nr:HlyD family efflux transporter periplasmic adaptor subunit [Desulfuromonas versatilis]BCR03238.1 secretion protein HlyD [Desulfuromonas versatilis]
MAIRSLGIGQPLLALAWALAALFSGCTEPPADYFQGYAEGEYVLVASPLAGQLETLAVARGARVERGTALFALEREQEQAALRAAEQEEVRAESRLEDLRKGQRPSELEALRARQVQARAALELSLKEFDRRQELFEQRVISGEELDRAAADLRRNRAAVAELQAELETARLGSRRDAVEAGRAELEAARARLDEARWAWLQKNQAAPQAALVFDTLFEPGEFVPAGYPVVSLLPPGNIKLRFFVPEPVVGTLRLGLPLAVSFDGSGGALPATISFISPQVEYTPPVIYSRETRAKLVFLVEARPDPGVAGRFHPGQPVEVRLEGGHE